MVPVVILLFPGRAGCGVGDGGRRCGRVRRAGQAFVLAHLWPRPRRWPVDVGIDSRGNLISSGRLAESLTIRQRAPLAPVVAAIVIGLSFVGHQMLSWRRAGRDRRQQLKWLACGGAWPPVAVWPRRSAWPALAGLSTLPVGVGVGIFRVTRCHDIDRIIGPTVAYGW